MNKTEFTKKLASRLSVSVKEAQQFMNVYQEMLGEVILDEAIWFARDSERSLYGANGKDGTQSQNRHGGPYLRP